MEVFTDPIFIFSLVAGAVVAVGIFLLRIIYKKTITYKVSLLTVLGMVMIAFICFLIGYKGLIHLTWAAPAAIVIVLGICYLIQRILSKQLGGLTERLSGTSSQLVAVSSGLSNASQEIAGGTSEQASGIEETTSSMEELASMVRQNLQNAKEASTLADKAASSSQDGFGQMEKMLESMQEINRSSDRISKVIKIIDDIAFQTNILALNAAVEAARAGEAGMGFAVVADEVKNLANRSAGASKETADMVEDSIKKTEEGLATATRMVEAFKDILENSRKVSEVSKEVEAASMQQDAGINQVNKAIVQFDGVVQANASAAEETASSAEELQSQVDILNAMGGELLSLVYGKKAENGRQQEVAREVKTLVEQTRAPTSKRAVPRTVKKKDFPPEKLIPFDEDEEFKDMDKT